MTQKRLADELGVTQQAVSMWLRGISKPDEKRRGRLAELTGVAVEDWDVVDDADDSGEHPVVAVDLDPAASA